MYLKEKKNTEFVVCEPQPLLCRTMATGARAVPCFFSFASRFFQRHPLDYKGSACLGLGDPRPNAQALPPTVLGI